MRFWTVNRMIGVALVLGLSAAGTMGAESVAAGKWRETLHGRPAAVLRLSDDGGRSGGSVLFYFLRDNGEGFNAAEAVPGPDEPEQGDKTFTFDLSCFRIPTVSLTITIRKETAGPAGMPRTRELCPQ